MSNSNSVSLYFLLFFMLFLYTFSFPSSCEHIEVGNERIGRRALKSFKETPNGGNVTFECSPSGTCVPCAYSEKKDEQYRCSETSYRIPLKCVKLSSDSKKSTKQKSQKGRSGLARMNVEVQLNGASHGMQEMTSPLGHRSLLDDSSTSSSNEQYYITYRSCIPANNEEKLSVLGFEGMIMVMLILSGSAIYFRRKRSNAAQGGLVRGPTNYRF